GDEGLRRYYAEITLFIGVMLGLVCANNYLLLYIFWELVGVCSYLLIGFWYKKPSAALAAKKAFIVTRAGDILLLTGIFIIFHTYGTLNFNELFEKIGRGDVYIPLIAALIFGGAIGKSAQFPFHVWLPDAMEGPTTVSALIHAATMVKAGVYLVARSFPIFSLTPDVMLGVAWIGCFTAFLAATMAIVMNDIKRVLAYSTVSQIGYMFLALGVGGYTAGMFHLMNHAFFKALLFLCAGSVIHAVHTNDMREMGGLHRSMKITSLTMLIGAISISGIIPFSGFWSKEEVLVSVFSAGNIPLFVLALITAFLTAFYMFRMWFLTFCGEEKKANESPKVMTLPLIILSFFAIFSGLTIFFGFGDFIQFEHKLEFEMNYTIFSLSTLVAVIGIILAYLVYYKKVAIVDSAKGIAKEVHLILSNKYYIDDVYNGFASFGVYGFAKIMDWFDLYGIDGIVNGISDFCIRVGSGLRRLHTGFIQHYATAIIIGMCLIWGICLLFWFTAIAIPGGI
ncbi:MAG: NADH-quinone oxidoreductase subunit L, partial [Candidatus Thermoplasmatota archaeon]